MTFKTFNFKIYNTNFYGQFWQPEHVKAVIVLVHGMGEHLSRFEDFVIPRLVENGYAVVGYDQFGHGRTEGKRGHCPGYEALLDSVQTVIQKAESFFPRTPMFLYGHSMGGNLVINYGLRRTHALSGVIATSPFLRLSFQPPKWKMIAGKFMLQLWPSITLPSGLDSKAISRDLNEVKRYQDDPMVHDNVSPMFTFPIIEAGKWAIENAQKATIPMLMVHGTGDRITDHKGSEELCSHSETAHLRLFENGYHELHHDLCREEFISVILDWLNTAK